MRQNPVLTSRVQIGGRPMPAWFSESLVNQARNSTRTPPPLPTEPPPEDESEYEEIEHLPRYTNTNMRRTSGSRRVCDLCGNYNAVARCEMCNNQIFCGSCNDMYHRHPKRHSHVRKILDSLENRPPLPPKVVMQLQQEPPLGPIAPPRRNRRFGMRSGTNSPTSARKFPFDPMGSLKRFVGGMGQRPLPSPPRNQQQTTGFDRPPTPTRSLQSQHEANSANNSFIANDRRHSVPHPPVNRPPQRSSSIQNNIFPGTSSSRTQPRACIPLSVLEISSRSNGNQPTQRQHQSMSVANLHEKQPSRDSGYRGWEEDDDDVFARSLSISASNLNHFPASNANHPHFATLQRNARNMQQASKPPLRPPPPVPPRDFVLQQHQSQRFQSASVCDLDRVGGTFSPWSQGYPYPDEFQRQQVIRMGYPGTLQRTPSASSAGGQGGFGWGPVGPFGPPMSQSEMELELRARRGSMPREFQPSCGNETTQLQFHASTPERKFNAKPPPHRQNSSPSTRQVKQHQPQPHPPQPHQQLKRVDSPARFCTTPVPVKNLRDLDDDYYSGEFRTPKSNPIMNQNVEDNEDEDDDLELECFTESPDGPWCCEHCTFVNPKSTRVCTICCKTPVSGYRLPQAPASYKTKPPSNKKIENRKEQRHYNTVEADIEDSVPVVKSKLSFSSSKAAKDQKVNLSVEQVRKLPWSTTSSSFDNNNSESDDSGEQVTQRQQYVHKNKHGKSNGQNRNTAKQIANSNEDVYGSVPITSWNSKSAAKNDSSEPPSLTGTSPSPSSRVSTGVGSSPLKYIDSGVGDSLVNETRSPKPPDQNSYHNHVPMTNAETVPLTQLKLTVVTPSNTGQISSGTTTSTSTSPLPTFFNHIDPETEKSSRGTSPPPQTISTQTYEELPNSKMRQKSVSKTSIQSGISGDVSPPPKTIEMSDKALRYARRAQQQTKLKRSLSTHLTSNASDNWIDLHHHEGRHLYRSSSRHSLASDTRSLPISGPPSRDVSPPRGHFQDDLHRFQPPSWDRFPSPADYFASVEDLVGRKRRESMRSQEFELSRLLKEAEEFNYTPEDLQVALRMCGDRNPIKWLQENWSSMIETVQTLGTKYGREKGHELNEVGTISPPESKDALRLHRGNVWAAVTECVEQRRKKFLELQSRGTFLREDILTALTANHGNLDSAYVELSKAQLKPFLMRIWGPPNGLDNNEPYSRSPSIMSIESSASHMHKNIKTTATPEPNPAAAPSVDSIRQTEPKLSTPLIATKTNEAIVAQIKSDGEEECFDDAVSDSESSNEQNKPTTTTRLHSDEVQPGETVSISDPELETEEAEAHISHFIQNFEISEPKATPNLVQVEQHETIQRSTAESGAANSNGNKTTQVSQIKRTPLTETEPSPDPENSTSEIASLTNAVNAISVQLQTLLKQQETPSTSKNTSPVSIPNASTENPKFNQIKQSFRMNENSSNIGNTSGSGYISENVKERNDNQMKSVKDNYRDDLTRLREIVLDSDERKALESIQPKMKYSGTGESDASRVYEAFEVRGHLASGSGRDLKEEPPKSRPYKLYEAIGNFAGTFLKSAMKIDQNSLADTSKIYETIQIQPSSSEKSDADAENQKETTVIDSLRRKEDKNLALTETLGGGTEDQPSTSHSQADLSSKFLLRNFSPENPNTLGLDSEEEELLSSSSSSEQDLPTGKILKEFLKRNQSNKTSNGSENDSIGEDEGKSDGESIEGFGESSQGDSSGSEIMSDGVFEPDVVEGVSSDDDVDEGQVYEDIDVTAQAKFDPPPKQTQAKALALETKERAGEPVKQIRKSVSPKPGEAEIKRLIKSGLAKSYEVAEIAVQLMGMHFDEEDSLYAAKECSSLYSALSFLQQECLLCAAKQSAKQMVSMLRCTHWCCRTCAAGYFMVQLKDHPIVEAVCPFCKEPSSLNDDPELATDYFSHLDMLLKDLLDVHYYEMFQRKLRDWTLAKTPNFEWCSKCSSGFFTDPTQSQTHLVCPDCSAVTCAICLEPWDKENHNHKDRDRKSNNPAISSSQDSSQSIIDYLNQNCIECPRCHLKFTLARGGCMHLTCSQCSFEFCSGCLAPFRIGSKCSKNSPFCVKLGLHAHHPRNCLFYLRDKEPDILSKLLEEKEIAYYKESHSTEELVKGEGTLCKVKKCQVPIQKESEDGLQDDLCGQDVLKGYSTVCQTHYVEYLGLLIWLNGLDPISILSNDDLETIIKREDKRVPAKIYGTKDADYRPHLLKVIENEIPLKL